MNPPNPSQFFPRAASYAGARELAAKVHEPAARFRVFPYTERHLQCVWSDPGLRPAELRTSEGELVRIESPGAWNLEAGPDFLGAALLLGSGRRRVTGDIEIHIHPSDWDRHGHASDPRYAGVVAHVTYFTGGMPAPALPPGCVQIALREELARNPHFAFESIDPSAYPYAARADLPPCAQVLSAWPPDRKRALLDAAGEERLRRKAERMALSIAERGEAQMLYEETLAALGYKHNKTAFRRLAELVRLEELRHAARHGGLSAYALLAGASGLLPEKPREVWDEETRTFLRASWDAWWRQKSVREGRTLAASAWRLSGLRPVNHPLRRMMAAVCLFTDVSDPLQWCLGGFTAAKQALEALHDTYWSFREGLGGKRDTATTQLIGGERADAILVNVVAPFLAATGRAARLGTNWLDSLPAEGGNAVIRKTANWLLGKDHPARLYASGLRRQGLLQIFHDYCLNDRSRCAACTFPNWLRSQTGGIE